MTVVNFPAGGRVNHRLNARAEEILRVSDVAAAGVLVRDLVRFQVVAGRPQAVARASLSRTLRRLWRAGLVELYDSLGHSLSTRQQEARERLVRFEADPQRSYRSYKAWATAVGKADTYGSAEAFLAAKRTQANAMPKIRVVRVTATALGRELAGRCGDVAEVRDDDRALPHGTQSRRHVGVPAGRTGHVEGQEEAKLFTEWDCRRSSQSLAVALCERLITDVGLPVRT